MRAHRFEGDGPSLKLSRRVWCIGCLAIGVSALAHTPLHAETIRDLHIVNGTLATDQRLIKVHQGDRLRWRVISNAPGALHLHAYRLNMKLQAGQTQELAFPAFATGRFRVEWHADGEPALAATGHHAPALAMLEVQPR